MNRILEHKKNISTFCMMLLCCVSISISFPRWASLDGTSWNWGCCLIIASILMMSLVFKRALSLQKKGILFSKGEIIGFISLCGLYSYLLYNGIDLYESKKLLASICFFLIFKQTQVICNDEKIVCHILLINAILSIIIGAFQTIQGEQNINGMQDSICSFSISLTFGGIATAYLFSTSKTKANKLIYLFILLACLSILIVTQSRIGVITFTICTCFMFNNKHINILILIICITASILLFLHKRESTLGRMFISSTTISMIHTPKQALWGQGADGFRRLYMQTQAKRLKKASNTERYRADNIHHPLNEFLLIAINYGCISLVLIILISISMLYRKGMSLFQKSLLAAITLYALFSYPYKYPLTWITFVWCISHGEIRRTHYLKGSCVIMLILAISCMYIAVNNLIGMEKWSKANNLRIMGMPQAAHKLYKDVLSHYFYPSEFLYNYASFLQQEKSLQQAMVILRQCGIQNYDTELLKGDIYFAQHQYSTAISHYQTASEMCPNRFIPLYAIYLSYGLINNKQMQKNIANIILTKKIKIESSNVTNIINNVKQNEIKQNEIKQNE